MELASHVLPLLLSDVLRQQGLLLCSTLLPKRWSETHLVFVWVVMERVSDSFYGDLVPMPGDSRHHMTQEVNRNSKRLSLLCAKFQTKEEKTQKGCDIYRTEGS